MKISDIEVINLRFAYPEENGFQYAGGYCTGRLTSLVRVTTDSGVVGIGSVYSHPEMVRTVVEGQLRELLLGRDPLETESIWEQCYKVTRWYGRKGVAMSALGGIDTALWDIRGKAAGKPLYQLLGAQRHSVGVYASGLLWKDDVSELREEVALYIKNGFRGAKTRLGRDYDYDHAAVRVLREALGPDRRLMIDGNGRYSLAQAERLLPEFQKADIYWLEEPFVPEAVDDYLALRPSLGKIPLAAGENDFGVQGFRELMDRKMVDIVQPDCCRAGGVTECHRIGLMASEKGLKVATHTWSDAVALVSNMHLIASLPTGVTVEMDQTGNPFIDDLLVDKLQVVDGELQLPQRPGLGIELNEEVVDRYTIPANEPIPEGNYADMVFGRDYYGPAGPYEADESVLDTGVDPVHQS